MLLFGSCLYCDKSTPLSADQFDKEWTCQYCKRVYTPASIPQPPPTPGEEKVLDLVMKDFQERAESGKAKYGTYLYTNNGRDADWDKYQELLDAVMYARQRLTETTLTDKERSIVEWCESENKAYLQPVVLDLLKIIRRIAR